MIIVWPFRGLGVRHGSTNQANSAFHPPVVGKWVVVIHVIYVFRGWRPLNSRQAAYGWLVIGQPVGAGLAYGLQAYANSVCDYINSASAVAVYAAWGAIAYKCYMHLPLPYLLAD